MVTTLSLEAKEPKTAAGHAVFNFSAHTHTHTIPKHLLQILLTLHTGSVDFIFNSGENKHN